MDTIFFRHIGMSGHVSRDSADFMNIANLPKMALTIPVLLWQIKLQTWLCLCLYLSVFINQDVL